ncbi:hypothetical protein [Chitinophaga qingshengii]|uniref:Uncharacterized protein n=1 Tax=Chitinophaga qingshengii TaxID=1569794 RepID=A0ABR7THD3_9BACT|nr:hypothetical protein [Chitinophaga qingshengii]MBC9928902.1 hypothetical protein [Chitinophaga qingshengii]
MLDLNHPDTPFIFQAAAHLDKLQLYWQHRTTVREEVWQTEIAALKTLAQTKFAKKEEVICQRLTAMQHLFDEPGDGDFGEILCQLEYDFGTWAI